MQKYSTKIACETYHGPRFQIFQPKRGKSAGLGGTGRRGVVQTRHLGLNYYSDTTVGLGFRVRSYRNFYQIMKHSKAIMSRHLYMLSI
jgi:hypothetical protein